MYTSKKTIKDRVGAYIKQSDAAVFVREDFQEFGSYDAVGRALKELEKDGTVMKPCFGVYVPAKKSNISGRLVCAVPVQEAMRSFLRKTGREPALSSAERAYNSGKSTQVPVGRVIGYRGKKTSRQFNVDGKSFIFENVA